MHNERFIDMSMSDYRKKTEVLKDRYVPSRNVKTLRKKKLDYLIS